MCFSSKNMVLTVTTPTNVEVEFKKYESNLGLSWAGFMLLTAAERRKVYKKMDASETIKEKLEDAIAADDRKLDISRLSFDDEILKVLKKCDEVVQPPKPKPTSDFVGIKNQSSTCYLNALLQSLYNVSYFRNLIYNMGVAEGTDPKNSIPLALQRLFFNLEMRQSLVTTTELTAAFGWDTSQAAIQHDIHELTRKLLDELESQMEGTEQADAIKRMMVGKMMYATHCLDAEYVSRREEAFYDLELVVKGNKGIMDSMRALCSTEKFDFKYVWEHDDGTKTEHEAERRTSFKHLPAILICHPQRLDFDMTTLQRVTVPDRWTFENEIDLAPFLLGHSENMRQHSSATAASPKRSHSNGGDGMEPQPSEEWNRENSLTVDNSTVYVLNSVVVHVGGAGFGHYYAIVKHGDRWIKFNDQEVTEVTQEMMEADSFGGTKTYTDFYGRTQTMANPNKCSLLIYINKAILDRIIFEIDQNKLPPYLHAGLEQQKAQAEEAEEARKREAGMMSFDVVGCSSNPGFVEGFMDKEKRVEIKVKREATVKDLKAAVEEKFGIVPEQQHLYFYHGYWQYEYYHQKDYRARFFDDDTPVKDDAIAGLTSYTRRAIFVNVVDKGTPVPETPKLLHVSRYENKQIHYAATVETQQQLVERFLETPRVIFVEHPTGKFRAVTHVNELISGDSIILAAEGTFKSDIEKAMDVKLHSMTVTMYLMLNNGGVKELAPVGVTEKMKFKEFQKACFDVLKQRRDSGEATEEELAFELPKDASYIGLRKHDSGSDLPHRSLGASVQSYYKTETTVKELLTSGYWGMIQRVYVNFLPAPIEEIERDFSECVYSVGDALQANFYVNLEAAETWGDLMQAALSHFPERAARHPKLRIVDAWQYTRVDKFWADPTQKLPSRGIPINLIFDELPVLGEDDVEIDGCPPMCVDLVNVTRVSGEDFHGFPTSIWVNKKDTGASLLQKIIAKLEVPEEKQAAAKKHWRVLFRKGHNSSVMIGEKDEAWEHVKHFSKTNSYTSFLVVDRSPKVIADVSGTSKRTAEPELKIRSHKDVKPGGSESPAPDSSKPSQS